MASVTGMTVATWRVYSLATCPSLRAPSGDGGQVYQREGGGFSRVLTSPSMATQRGRLSSDSAAERAELLLIPAAMAARAMQESCALSSVHRRCLLHSATTTEGGSTAIAALSSSFVDKLWRRCGELDDTKGAQMNLVLAADQARRDHRRWAGGRGLAMAAMASPDGTALNETRVRRLVAMAEDGTTLGEETISTNLAMAETSAASSPSDLVTAMDGRRMSLVFVGAEASPWAKVGGLGDFMGALPPALATLILLLYIGVHALLKVTSCLRVYKDAWDTQTMAQVTVGGKVETVRFFHARKCGVDRVFVDHPLFLEKAAVQAPLLLNLASEIGPYGEDITFIVNDWHAALVPLYLKSRFKSRGIFSDAKVALCLHNVSFQGLFREDQYSLEFLDLPKEYCAAFSDDHSCGAAELCGEDVTMMNWMKAGFEESDLLLTVSPTYAEEVSTDGYLGTGLKDLIRKKGLIGIMNGADVTEWSPVTDKFLSIQYDTHTVFGMKPLLKKQLQEEVGLPAHPDVPLFGFMGRLVGQKGSDILAAAISTVLQSDASDAQFLILGTGKSCYEEELQELEEKFPTQVAVMTVYCARLAHMMTAGCDFMVMPSRYEPAGLVQLHAMLYGTVPVVSSTGGLLDSVRDGETGLQIGRLTYKEKLEAGDIAKVVRGLTRGMEVYRDPSRFRSMILACMSQDLSWKGPARAWEQALLKLYTENSRGIETGKVCGGPAVQDQAWDAFPAAVVGPAEYIAVSGPALRSSNRTSHFPQT
ncbi:hypothetical protein CBR_g36223 [Chara braunii]|uniref:Starch synthase catalytic domain-containing protein n=1 Tax=Chara braunii TaxID=69332 RepID=A0A388LKD9_CHABU|nr:hypothetical protein CBR_g36223 [Chara braunii]|eukprot:GBG82693.1 hypothetical protein CBR_g36223 [Chara braunii]